MATPSISSAPSNPVVVEAVLKASHSASFVVSDLKPALQHASGVEAIVILGLIEAATELKRRIDQLHAAMESSPN